MQPDTKMEFSISFIFPSYHVHNMHEQTYRWMDGIFNFPFLLHDGEKTKNRMRITLTLTYSFFPSRVLRCVSKDSRRLSGACGGIQTGHNLESGILSWNAFLKCDFKYKQWQHIKNKLYFILLFVTHSFDLKYSFFPPNHRRSCFLKVFML